MQNSREKAIIKKKRWSRKRQCRQCTLTQFYIYFPNIIKCPRVFGWRNGCKIHLHRPGLASQYKRLTPIISHYASWPPYLLNKQPVVQDFKPHFTIWTTCDCLCFIQIKIKARVPHAHLKFIQTNAVAMFVCVLFSMFLPVSAFPPWFWKYSHDQARYPGNYRTLSNKGTIKGLLIQMRSEISKKRVPFAARHLSTQETAMRRLPQGHSHSLW